MTISPGLGWEQEIQEPPTSSKPGMHWPFKTQRIEFEQILTAEIGKETIYRRVKCFAVDYCRSSWLDQGRPHRLSHYSPDSIPEQATEQICIRMSDWSNRRTEWITTPNETKNLQDSYRDALNRWQGAAGLHNQVIIWHGSRSWITTAECTWQNRGVCYLESPQF